MGVEQDFLGKSIYITTRKHLISVHFEAVLTRVEEVSIALTFHFYVFLEVIHSNIVFFLSILSHVFFFSSPSFLICYSVY